MGQNEQAQMCMRMRYSMINRIRNEIEKCLVNECFIAALSLSLTLVDTCGKAEYPEKGNKDRFISWYDSHIGDKYKPTSEFSADMPYMSGELAYQLRCMLLHQSTPSAIDTSQGKKKASVKDERNQINEFVLTISSDTDEGLSIVSYAQGRCVKDSSLKVSVLNLCRRIVNAARSYYEQNASRFDFFKYEIVDEREFYERLDRKYSKENTPIND